MNSNVLPGWIEIPLLTGTALGGGSILWLFGVRRPWLLLGASALGGALIAGIFFLVSIVLNDSVLWLSPWAGSAIFFATLLFTSRRTTLVWVALMSTVMVGVAWVVKYVNLVPERPGEDSVLVVVQSLWFIQQGELPNDPKRGLAYPLLLALGREEQLLTSVTPFIAISAVVLLAGFLKDLIGESGRSLARHVAIPLGMAVVLSSPIVVLALVYLNSHTLMALAISAVAGSSLAAIRRNALTLEDLTLLFFGLFIGSLTRFEGGALMILAMAPLMIAGPASFGQRGKYLWLLVPIPGALTFWWGSFVNPDQLPAPAYLIAGLVFFLPIGILLFRSQAGTLGEVWLLGGGSAVLGILVVALPFFLFSWPDIQRSSEVTFRNIMLGASGWGVVIPVTIGVTLWMLFRRTERTYRAAALIWIWGLMFSLILKYIDGPLTSEGFNDSFSRSLLHWVGPQIYLWVLWLSNLFESKSVRPFSGPYRSWH